MKKEEHFSKLITENSERIQRICRYYGASYQDDLYQEVLINIWKSLDGFRGDCAISTWIYRIAVNTSLTYAGKAYKQLKLTIAADIDSLNLLVENPEQENETEEQLAKLQNELNQLPIIDKALISLMLEGLSMREIAGVIGLTESNVKVKIHRIKTNLKTKLNRP